MNNKDVVIQGVDLCDIVEFMNKKNKRFQAMTLSNLEEILDPKSNEFKYTRKIFLDCFNNFNRSVIEALFGDIENEGR